MGGGARPAAFSATYPEWETTARDPWPPIGGVQAVPAPDHAESVPTEGTLSRFLTNFAGAPHYFFSRIQNVSRRIASTAMTTTVAAATASSAADIAFLPSCSHIVPMQLA